MSVKEKIMFPCFCLWFMTGKMMSCKDQVCVFITCGVFWFPGGLWCGEHSLSHPEDQQVSEVTVKMTLSHCAAFTWCTPHLPTTLSCLVLCCSDPGLFVYCCDFSSTAVELVKVGAHWKHHHISENIVCVLHVQGCSCDPLGGEWGSGWAALLYPHPFVKLGA